jgi:SNF2 family DNA or RNA helicase
MATKSVVWNKENTAKILLGLYARQTDQEKVMGGTISNNSVGFNALDAAFCSNVARWILDNKPFTAKQYNAVYPKLKKYKRQISEIDWESIILPARALGAPVAQNNGKPHKLVGDGLLIIEEEMLRFYPNIYPSKQVKQVWQCLWRKPYWEGLCYLDTIKRIQDIFPQIVIDNSVKQHLDALTTVSMTNKEIVEHEILFPFQKESTHLLMQRDRAMLALAPGLGKTACAIFAAHQLQLEHILVVCPTSLMLNWQNEIEKWVGEKSTIWHKTTGQVKDEKWIITNYETVARKMTEKDPTHKGYGGTKFKAWRIKDKQYKELDALIVDESVMVKNRKAQRTQAIKAMAKAVKRAWLLSGSPTTRFYDDLWAQFNILDRRRFSSYWRFAKDYCYVEQTQWGMTINANKPNAAQDIQDNYADIYFARTQDEVLDLPDWIIDNYPVRMDKNQSKAYLQMENHFFSELPDGDVVLSPNILSQITRLIQIASNPHMLMATEDYDVAWDNKPPMRAKWDATIELLEFEKLPAIIWTNYLATANELAKLVAKKKYSVDVLTGQTPVEVRQIIVDTFQEGKTDVIIAHPGVGKFGLTLTAARTAIYLERSYNGDDYYQSLHRIRRIGTKHSPHVIHLLATTESGDNTIDHVIDRVLKYRKDSAIKLTSGLIRDILN